MVITAGVPGAVPGPQTKSTLLSLKPSADDRRGVPPVEVEGLPARVHGQGLEVAAVADEVAVDLADAARAESFGELAQPGERVGLAGALAQRVGREAALAEGRIAAAVEHEVALQHAAGRPARRRRGWSSPSSRAAAAPTATARDHDLGVARGDEELARVPAVEQRALLVHQRDAPEVRGRRAARRGGASRRWGRDWAERRMAIAGRRHGTEGGMRAERPLRTHRRRLSRPAAVDRPTV